MSRIAMLNMIGYDIFIYAWIIFLIQSTQYVILWIEQWNKELFQQWIWIMVWISVVLVLISIFRKPRVFKIFSDIWYNIDTLYLKKIIYGNNIQFEKLWTWKLIAVYSKWAGTWSDLWTSFLTDWLTTIFLFGYFLYTASTKNFNMFRWILCALILIIVWFWKFWWLSYVLRAKAKENELEKSRMQVRWLMSKYEIMQTANIPQELEKSERINSERYTIKIKEKYLQWIGFDIPFFIACILFTLLIWVSWKEVLNWTLEISDMVWIVWIGTIFIKELQNLLRRVRFLFDKWIDITKLRDIVDMLDTWKQQLDKWKHFIIKNDSIQFKNINFSYDTNENKILSELECIIWWKHKTALVGPHDEENQH